jgi:hypothetical protein
VRPAELLDFGQARIPCSLSHYPLVSGFELVFTIQRGAERDPLIPVPMSFSQLIKKYIE